MYKTKKKDPGSYSIWQGAPVANIRNNYGRGGNNYRHAVEIIMGAAEIIIATRWK